jgi:PAS domain S-box-containing protein
MFDSVVALRQSIDRLRSDYHVEVSIGGEVVYRSLADDPRRNPGNTVERTYNNLANRNVHLSVAPSRAALEKGQRYLPELALGAGFGISVLLGLSVHLARSARAGQRSAEHSNRRLSSENDERRRVEARLKVSDERLRLALDSTQIGIFEWSVPAGHVYYSPGLWAMLGFEHARMPSTVEAWQSLVHPEDLPLYQRRIESQLSGLATFIEPEFRVRTHGGEWRWVYTRSKTVAAGADGRPTRIIGTVQDITARREAEFALRESQSEARKLSLVAAKTDNPVLIGSADGRIEWVNEAFCRVMEYSLEEVVGKNPAHFMIGPETSPRAVVRIRAAMANGHGIGADVVNYSKSGRKYHLHLEIQPVRNAAGEVETFIAVETDITARVETERELRRAKAEADEASRAKSEFLASMSHEIRTPMNGVIGMTSLLMETTLSVEQRDYINTIRTSGEALLTIINDILDFSKIESGKMELERAPFELALCVEEALDLFALQVSAKKLALVYHIAPRHAALDCRRRHPTAPSAGEPGEQRGEVHAERKHRAGSAPGGPRSRAHRLRAGAAGRRAQAILQFTVPEHGHRHPARSARPPVPGVQPGRLLHHAQIRRHRPRPCDLPAPLRAHGREHSGREPAWGRIRVHLHHQHRSRIGHDGGGAAPDPAALRDDGVLAIEDDAVAQERLRTLFEKWGVACTLRPTPAAAAEALAQLHRPPGLVDVQRRPFRSPQPLRDLPRTEVRLAGDVSIRPDRADATGRRPAVRERAQAAADQRPPPGDHRAIRPPPRRDHILEPGSDRTIGEEFPLEVLLAEDNAVNQKVALRFLDRLGYRADAVANGLEVLSTLEHRRYDLILMDLQMPEMDGLETSRQIRARLPADRQPRIIALTANAMHGDREACIAAGMERLRHQAREDARDRRGDSPSVWTVGWRLRPGGHAPVVPALAETQPRPPRGDPVVPRRFGRQISLLQRISGEVEGEPRRAGPQERSPWTTSCDRPARSGRTGAARPQPTASRCGQNSGAE